MNDKFTKGIICGTIGSFADLAIHFPSFFLFKISTTAHYIAQLMFGQKINNLELLMGLLVHFMAGAGLGVFFVYLLDYIDTNYIYIKGLSLGLVTFILHVIVIPNIINNPHGTIRRDLNEAIVDLIAHIAYGLVVAWVFRRTTHKKLIA